ncbi:MAG: ABC transporter permease [Flavobacteriaceae bacterium]
MNFPLYIAKRYLISKSSNNAINIIAGISVLGVVLGTLALSIVLAGFSGLKTFSLSFLNASDPDIRISAQRGKTFIPNEDLVNFLNEQSNISAYNYALEERAFYNYKGKQVVAYLKGVDSNFQKTSNISQKLIVGKWLDGSRPNQVVVGNGISGQLALGILNYGDPLRILVPKPGQGYVSNIRDAFNLIDTQATGVFASSEDLDNNYVFTNLPTIQNLLGLPEGTISEIDIRLKNPDESSILIAQLKQDFGSFYKIQNRQELNAVFYRMLNTENLVSYLIFTFIVIIALFNVIGAIIMMILDKRSNLKTMHAMGARIRDIKRIFIQQGFLLTQIGLYLGIGISLILLLIQKVYTPFMITSRIAYPVELKLSNFILVIVTISFLGYISALIAASRINKEFIDKA